MELRFWAATDTGRVRDHNEDNFLVDERLQLFVVCDGMGGHAAGEVASAVCVRTVREVVAAEGDFLQAMQQNPDDPVGKKRLEDLMGRAVLTACKRIFEMAQQDPSRRGMGTTCTAMVLAGPRGFVGHVGDSRMYRLRRGEVEQITVDHSLLNEMIRQGKLPADTREQDFPHKNAVTRAVGVRDYVEVDTFVFDVLPGDRLLMCSDGLSEYFGDHIDMVDMVGGQAPKETTSRCIDHANRSGGKDNITVIVIDSVDVAGQQEDEQRIQEILLKTPYFHYLAPQELEQLKGLARRLEFEANEYVVAPGASNDRLFIILKGSVSLQLDGRQVSVLTTGENFGEMAVIDAQNEQDVNLIARALEPTMVMAIPRDEFVGLLRTAPGLAIKLLWNFVQVFADRLQAVPAEYRFTPDEWRGEPDAVVDLTPPSGSLVFKEDLRRHEENRAEEAAPRLMSSVGSAPVPALPQESMGDADAPVAPPMVPDLPEEFMDFEKGGDDTGSGPKEASGPEEASDPEDSRKTLDLSDVDLRSIGVAPPRTGPTSRVLPEEEKSNEGPWGLSSGTYDQRILAGGVSGTMDFEDNADGDEDDEGEGEDQGVHFGNHRADPDVTLSPWDQAAGSSPSASDSEEPDEDDEMAKTLDFNADVDSLRSLRAQTARDLKDKLRERMKGRAAPSAEVLRKAKTTPTPDSSSPEEVDDGGMSGESFSGGASGTRREPEPSQPKIMISPDLMAELDDDT